MRVVSRNQKAFFLYHIALDEIPGRLTHKHIALIPFRENRSSVYQRRAGRSKFQQTPCGIQCAGNIASIHCRIRANGIDSTVYRQPMVNA